MNKMSISKALKERESKKKIVKICKPSAFFTEEVHTNNWSSKQPNVSESWDWILFDYIHALQYHVETLKHIPYINCDAKEKFNL